MENIKEWLKGGWWVVKDNATCPHCKSKNVVIADKNKEWFDTFCFDCEWFVPIRLNTQTR
jgi:transcription elongation factor Elf1